MSRCAVAVATCGCRLVRQLARALDEAASLGNYNLCLREHRLRIEALEAGLARMAASEMDRYQGLNREQESKRAVLEAAAWRMRERDTGEYMVADEAADLLMEWAKEAEQPEQPRQHKMDADGR